MEHSEEQLDAFAEWERQAWETRAAPNSALLTGLTSGASGALLDAAGVGGPERLGNGRPQPRTGLFGPVVQSLGLPEVVPPGPENHHVADGTPRTGAVLAAASAEKRAELKARYVEVATASFGASDGKVVLPAAAVVGSGLAG